MRPLNFAILNYMTTVEKASYVEIMDDLKGEYGTFKQFNPKAISETLMTAMFNCLLVESGFELNEDGTGRFYYTADEEGVKTIKSYIK